MGMYNTEVNMEFGTTLKFKRDFEYGIFTFPTGEEVRVANYVHKYYVEIYHKQVQDLIKIKIELIDDLLEEVEPRKCENCKNHYDVEKSYKVCNKLEISTGDDFYCSLWEKKS